MNKFIVISVLLIVGLKGFGQENKTIEKATKIIKEKEDYVKALEMLNEFIRKDSSYAQAFCQRAWCLCKVGNYDKAISDAKYALTLDSNDEEIYCTLGSIYAITNEYELSLENFNKSIAINPKYAPSYNSRGALYLYFLNDSEKALDDFTMALKINPKKDYTYYNRALYYSSKGQYTTAIKDLTTSLKLRPKKSDALFEKGKCHYYLNEYNQAITDFKKTIKYNKPVGPFGKIENGEVFYWIALSYQELNKTGKAELYFNKAEKLGYTNE